MLVTCTLTTSRDVCTTCCTAKAILTCERLNTRALMASSEPEHRASVSAPQLVACSRNAPLTTWLKPQQHLPDFPRTTSVLQTK
eukprot:5830265-Amphidinium_carterae.1